MVSLSQTAGDSGGKDMRLSIRSLVSIAVLAIGSLSITMPASAGTGAASFAPGTPMHFARAFPTATELLNGNVLRAAGYDGGQFFSDAEIYNWHSGTWTTVAPMHVARAAAMAVRLSGGRVMVIGGFGPGFSVLDSVEIYDPRADSWSVTGSLNQRRAEDFLAAVLPDGRVLVAGGFIFANPMIGLFVPTNSAEIWNPGTGTWSPTTPMHVTRGEFTATELKNGRILAAGGINAAGPDNTAEIYDPSRGDWALTGSLNIGRFDHAAALLLDGRVLVAGGEVGFGAAGGIRSNTAELYDPHAGTWSLTGSMTSARSEAEWATVRLPDGNVLVTGGFVAEETPQSSADLYHTATGVWSSAGSMSVARAGQAAVLLRGNRGVLVMGGLVAPPFSTSSVDIYR
ncbi:MAG: hypothetical protein E6I88_13925 [Chloroflexi bacterium]|nr:MAG: hypothetical protein E6I88_13925 [Chloroflexota bacterium]